VLWKAVQANWKTFLAELEAAAEAPALPGFVVAEVEAFLKCGILGHGFLRCRCKQCGWCRAVALSCQRRGFCPSCIGRRMSDTAARWVDRVIPSTPVRQWVLTVPHGLRAKLAFDPKLATLVLRGFVAAASQWLRRRARRLGIRGTLKTGGVTVIQRFNSALDVSVHFHTLMIDGVYTFPVGRAPVFHPTPAPTDEDVAAVAAAVFRKVERALGRFAPSAQQRRFAEDASLLLAIGEASSRGVGATGPRRGRRAVRVRGLPPDAEAFVMGKLCAQVEGYNLQAATRLAANDREGLERMGRYLARPPIATDRLSRRPDGNFELLFKRPWRDGTTAMIFTGHELMERLCALVPRPRAHLVRYHGVLAPAFAARAQIVPTPIPDAEATAPRSPPPEGVDAPRGPGRLPWASLLWRVFRKDALQCERCDGRMEIVAAVLRAGAITRVLDHMGLPSAVPGFHPARPPPQLDLPFDDGGSGFEADPPAPDDYTT